MSERNPANDPVSYPQSYPPVPDPYFAAASEPRYAQGGYTPHVEERPKTHLVMAILTTIFGFLPFGIVSIVKSSQVDSAWQVGDYERSRAASASAKKWWLAALFTQVGLFVLWLLFVGFLVIAASTV
jgi:hypothetical protein